MDKSFRLVNFYVFITPEFANLFLKPNFKKHLHISSSPSQQSCWISLQNFLFIFSRLKKICWTEMSANIVALFFCLRVTCRKRNRTQNVPMLIFEKNQNFQQTSVSTLQIWCWLSKSLFDEKMSDTSSVFGPLPKCLIICYFYLL